MDQHLTGGGATDQQEAPLPFCDVPKILFSEFPYFLQSEKGKRRAEPPTPSAEGSVGGEGFADMLEKQIIA